MMKNAVLSVLLVTFSTCASAQLLEAIETGETCSFFGEDVPANVATFSSDSEAEEAIARIVDASGLVQNFQIRAAGVPNAAAVVYEEKRYILYNQYFMRDTREAASSDWAPISIMAHEVGHHLNGHTLDNLGSRPNIELEADYYSGFILQRLGATLEEARAAMQTLGSDVGSDTHPAKNDRLAAIDNGWIRACQSDASCDAGAPGGSGLSPDINTAQRMPTPSSTPASVPQMANQANSCQWAFDGECDEPNICSAGTDTADCDANPNNPNSCQWAFDGECDEPNLCPRGSDTADCSSGGQAAGANSCQWAFDGECDEPELCASGTDTADCSRGTNSCQWAFDGECDEPQLCPQGTDTADCQVTNAQPMKTGSRLPARQDNAALYPTDQVMQDCGCWGSSPVERAPEPLCHAGHVVIAICEAECEGGGSSYGYVCQ